MPSVTFVTYNAPTKIWSRTGEGIISYPSTVTAAVGGPFIVNPITVPFDPVHATGGAFWRLTEGPNIGFLVSAHSNSLGYGDITITQTGTPASYAEGIAKIDPLASWRLLIKDMGGETGGSSHMLTFNDTTFVWSRTTTGIISWPHEEEHDAGGPYAVNPIVVPFDPEHQTGGSFWRLTEGPFTGYLVSYWSNELSYGDITVEDNPDFDRGPGAVLVTLGPGDVVPLPSTGAGDQPPHLLGASATYNTGGEMHFTLLVDSPFIDIPQPKRTHWAVEFWDKDAQEWVEPSGGFAGWVWDIDATDTEVVFYGIDYLAAFQYTVDERYDPELGIDVPAPNGSLYIGDTIREIIISQLDYAISRTDSMVGFVVRGDIAPMPYVISRIYSTFKDTLNFVIGLIDSHRAGTGKYTRLSVRKIDGVYTVMIEDDPGVDRNNLLIQYGGLAQGYRVIPFGLDWASRVNFIGRNKEGLKVFYRAESSAVDQGLWGRIAQAPVYMDTEDYNDMKRRALQAAIDASRLGRLISVGLKLGSFRPMEGYDITDNLPIDINHGGVTTKDWGSDDFGTDPVGDPSGTSASFWTILGVSWETYDDGHWMTGLTLYPKGRGEVPGEEVGGVLYRAQTNDSWGNWIQVSWPCTGDSDFDAGTDGCHGPFGMSPIFGPIHYLIGVGSGPFGNVNTHVGWVPEAAGSLHVACNFRSFGVNPSGQIQLRRNTTGAGDDTGEHVLYDSELQGPSPGISDLYIDVDVDIEVEANDELTFWYRGSYIDGGAEPNNGHWIVSGFLGQNVPSEPLLLEAPVPLVIGNGPPA